MRHAVLTSLAFIVSTALSAASAAEASPAQPAPLEIPPATTEPSLGLGKIIGGGATLALVPGSLISAGICSSDACTRTGTGAPGTLPRAAPAWRWTPSMARWP